MIAIPDGWRQTTHESHLFFVLVLIFAAAMIPQAVWTVKEFVPQYESQPFETRYAFLLSTAAFIFAIAVLVHASLVRLWKPILNVPLVIVALVALSLEVTAPGWNAPFFYLPYVDLRLTLGVQPYGLGANLIGTGLVFWFVRISKKESQGENDEMEVGSKGSEFNGA